MFSKVIECLKQNIRKQVDCYLRTNNDDVYVCKIYLSGLIFWRERGEAYLRGGLHNWEGMYLGGAYIQGAC